MLVQFLTLQGDRSVEAEIVKYADRIWLDKNGVAEILHSIIVGVVGGHPLEQLSMLLAVEDGSIEDLRDASETCFKEPDECYFNRAKTNGYRIEEQPDTDGLGYVFVDGFNHVEVCTQNRVTHKAVANSCLVTVSFGKKPIAPGSFRKLRLYSKLKLPVHRLNNKEEESYTIEFGYFDATSFQDAIQIIGGQEHEIPVRAIIDHKTRQGGFDVFVYLPPSFTGRNWWGGEPRTEYVEVSGQEAGVARTKYTFRLRKWLVERSRSPEEIPSLRIKASEDPFRISGDVVRRLPLLNALNEKVRKLAHQSHVAILIGGAAILLAVVGIILTLCSS